MPDSADANEEWAGWTDQQLIEYGQRLYDEETEGGGDWAMTVDGSNATMIRQWRYGKILR
jgi:hypothetical protein